MAGRRRQNSQQSQRWLPRTGAHSSLMLGNGMIARLPWSGTAFDHEAWHCGNGFQTSAQAAHAREQVTEVLLTLHQAQR